MISIAHAGAILPLLQPGKLKCSRSRARSGRVFIIHCQNSAIAAAPVSKVSIIDELLTKLEQRPAPAGIEAENKVSRVYRVKDEELVPGKVLRGRVISIVRYGAFVDIGARITGLVHISRLSAGLITNVAEVVKVGEEFDVEIVLADVQKGRIELKKVASDGSSLPPASDRADDGEFVVGKTLTGRVKTLARYGAFVDVGASFDGFIHISSLGLKNVKRVEDVIQVGEQVQVQVVVADIPNRRIQLRRILTNSDFKEDEDEESSYSVKLKELVVDRIMTGRVKSIFPYGAFVDLGARKDGLIHISNLGPEYVSNVEEVLKIGDEVTVQVILADLPNERFQLRRIKVPDEELVVEKVLNGRVKGIVSYGAFVDIGARFKGLLHIAALNHHTFVNKVEEVVKVGDEVEVKIVEADVASARLLLQRVVKPVQQAESNASTATGFGSNTVVKVSRSYERGEKVSGVVIRRNKFGVWLQLPGNEGFLQKKEMRDGEAGEIKIGKEVKVRVKQIMGGRIMLSMKEEGEEEERREERRRGEVERINEQMNEDSEPAPSAFEVAFRQQPVIRRYLKETGLLQSERNEEEGESSSSGGRTGRSRSIKSYGEHIVY